MREEWEEYVENFLFSPFEIFTQKPLKAILISLDIGKIYLKASSNEICPGIPHSVTVMNQSIKQPLQQKKVANIVDQVTGLVQLLRLLSTFPKQ